MLGVSLADKASAGLATMPARLQSALAAKMNALATELQEKIQQKLLGGVLNARTGALARAIVATIQQSDSGIAVTIGTNGDVKYAAIHEFGGVIPPHDIVPDKAKALAFVVGGKPVFATRVSLPAVTMPERSYMRSALADMADEIRDEMTEVVVETMQ